VPNHLNEVSDADVLRLYDFVYNNLSDVKKALRQIQQLHDTPDLRVQQLTSMTTHLGSSARKQTFTDQEQHPVQITSSVNIGDYNEFMERSKGRNIEAFNSAGIFYLAGVSKVTILDEKSNPSNIALYYVLSHDASTLLQWTWSCSLTISAMYTRSLIS